MKVVPAFRIALLLCTAVLCAAASAATPNWPQFRGPNGQGISEEGKPPVEFGPEKNLLWKVPLSPGHSSPVVWGDRIFLTAHENGKLSTLCLDRSTGRTLWSREAPVEKLQNVHPFSNPAASTPATDGERVYSYFGSYGLIGYDFAGTELWKRPLPVLENKYGTATSPIVQGNNVILACDGGSESHLLAVDGKTGETVWDKDRPLVKESWSSPVIWRGKDGDQILVAGWSILNGYDAATGDELWWVRGLNEEHITLPVVSGDILLVASSGTAGGSEQRPPLPGWKEVVEKFDRNKDNKVANDEVTEKDEIILRPHVAEGLPGRTMSYHMLIGFFDANKDGAVTDEEWSRLQDYVAANADTVFAVRLGGLGNLSTTNTLWSAKRGVPEMPSPLAYRGRLYMVRSGGMVTSYDIETGKMILDRERLGAQGQYCASPVAASGFIYTVSEPGKVTVFKAADTLEIAASSDLGERVVATPAIASDKIYIRSASHLWAFGASEPPSRTP